MTKTAPDPMRCNSPASIAASVTASTLSFGPMVCTSSCSVAPVNVVIFAGVSALSEAEKIEIYGRIYLYALIIPIVSVSGVFLAMYLKRQRLEKLIKSGVSDEELKKLMTEFVVSTQPNW